LDSVTNYIDDILVTSTLRPTYAETVAVHFQNVGQAVERLAFHGAKINVMKCEWARSKILFLGWYISHDFIVADFTLAEWIDFVRQNPEYLTVNRGDHLPVKAIVMSINRGIQRIQDVHTPLEILQKRLEKPEFVSKQKKEMTDICNACLRAKHFEYTLEEGEKKTKYKLMGDLLMIFKDDYKICVPPSMVGLLLSHHHLIAHKGLTRMLAELEPYHFKNNILSRRDLCRAVIHVFFHKQEPKE
jgi:hypothetical protein